MAVVNPFFSSQICGKHHLWWWELACLSLATWDFFFFFPTRCQELCLTIWCGCCSLLWKCISIPSKWFLSVSYQLRLTSCGYMGLQISFGAEVISQKMYFHQSIWKGWGGHSVSFTGKNDNVYNDFRKRDCGFYPLKKVQVLDFVLTSLRHPV